MCCAPQSGQRTTSMNATLTWIFANAPVIGGKGETERSRGGRQNTRNKTVHALGDSAGKRFTQASKVAKVWERPGIWPNPAPFGGHVLPERGRGWRTRGRRNVCKRMEHAGSDRETRSSCVSFRQCRQGRRQGRDRYQRQRLSMMTKGQQS